MYCWRCGSVIKEEAKVCDNCGASVDRFKDPKGINEETPTVNSRYSNSDFYENKYSREDSYGYRNTNGMAIAGFVCSFFIPILGWIFGGLGLNKALKCEGKGMGLSVAAIAISTVSFIIGLVISIVTGI